MAKKVPKNSFHPPKSLLHRSTTHLDALETPSTNRGALKARRKGVVVVLVAVVAVEWEQEQAQLPLKRPSPHLTVPTQRIVRPPRRPARLAINEAMPLRIIRTPTKARDILFAATAFASLTVDVSDMVQFTPVRAAASIILVILQTIQEMDANKDACYRLARHAAKVLLDLRRRMDGKWDTAPAALIENIRDFEQCVCFFCSRDTQC